MEYREQDELLETVKRGAAGVQITCRRCREPLGGMRLCRERESHVQGAAERPAVHSGCGLFTSDQSGGESLLRPFLTCEARERASLMLFTRRTCESFRMWLRGTLSGVSALSSDMGAPDGCWLSLPSRSPRRSSPPSRVCISSLGGGFENFPDFWKRTPKHRMVNWGAHSPPV